MRLDKLLTLLGEGTRSEIKAAVRAGRVTVDGAGARTIALISLRVPSPSSASSLSSRIFSPKIPSPIPASFQVLSIIPHVGRFCNRAAGLAFFCQPRPASFLSRLRHVRDKIRPDGHFVFKNCPVSGGCHGNIT